jgi:hypothetical protein
MENAVGATVGHNAQMQIMPMRDALDHKDSGQEIGQKFSSELLTTCIFFAWQSGLLWTTKAPRKCALVLTYEERIAIDVNEGCDDVKRRGAL